jgi:hypothetical protein
MIFIEESWEFRMWERRFMVQSGNGAAVSSSPSPARTEASVEAQSFVLRDAHGCMRAHLGFEADQDAVGLRLLDEREQSRVHLSLGKGEGSELTFQDAQGKPSLRLYAGAEGAAQLMLCDESGRNRCAVETMPGGSARVQLNDMDGGTRAALSVGADGCPRLTLFGKDGKPLAAVLVLRDGIPIINLYGPNGQVAWSAV